MKRIFDGKVLEIIPSGNSLVFSYQKDITPTGNMVLGFKMYSLDTKSLSDVTKNVYLLSKFGANYSDILPFCDNYILTKVLHLSGGRTFLCGGDGKSVLLDSGAVVTWAGELKYHGQVPSALALDGNDMWGCFSRLDTCIRFNTATLREELRIGKKGSALKKPIAMFVEDGAALVCLAGGNRLVKINLSDFSVENKYYFEEPVLEYTKMNNYEFAVLSSGLYELEVI